MSARFPLIQTFGSLRPLCLSNCRSTTRPSTDRAASMWATCPTSRPRRRSMIFSTARARSSALSWASTSSKRPRVASVSSSKNPQKLPLSHIYFSHLSCWRAVIPMELCTCSIRMSARQQTSVSSVQMRVLCIHLRASLKIFEIRTPTDTLQRSSCRKHSARSTLKSL